MGKADELFDGSNAHLLPEGNKGQMELTAVFGDQLKRGKFWTTAWSLVEGCTPVSPGCAHCWLAERSKDQTVGNSQEVLTKDGNFIGRVFCREDRLNIPIRATKPRVYAIWSDLFHDAVPDEFLNQTFDTIKKARHHHFIIVTKRPARAVAFLKASWPRWSAMANVTFLVTMEDQERATERMLDTVRLAVMRWRVGILAEPLLGPIELSLTGTVPEDIYSGYSHIGQWISWILVGGESGPNARPVHPTWVRSLRDQAAEADIPFMFKGWGEWSPYDGGGPVDDDPEITKFLTMYWNGEEWEDIGYPSWSCFQDYWDADECTARVGKRKAGNLLDGKQHLALPSL